MLCPFLANAQERFSIIGKVSESSQNLALPFVNVFLEGTTIGIQTNQNGDFSLKNIPQGNYRLVASFVGYKTFVQNIIVSNKDISFRISLIEDAKLLNEIKVIGTRDKNWEEQLKIFENDFLGSNYSKNEVRILNKERIDFEVSPNTFKASATEPLRIENQLLGYKIDYELAIFEKQPKQIAYKGLSKFSLIEPKNEKQKIEWEQNRIVAYEGSVRHFFKSLVDKQLINEGFKAFLLNPEANKSASAPLYFELNLEKIVSPNDTNGFYNLNFPSTVIIVYETSTTGPHFSQIFQKSAIVIDQKGNLSDPYAIEVSGKMGRERISFLLPADFEFESKVTIKKEVLPDWLKSFSAISKESISIEGLNSNYLAGEEINLVAYIQNNSEKLELINTDSDQKTSPKPISENQSNLNESAKSFTSNEMTSTSIPLYVELIDLTKGILTKRFTLRLIGEQAKLSFSTPLLLPTGNYQIRAYTNWMRNFSEKSFYRKNITIFSINYKQEKPESAPTFDTLVTHIEAKKMVAGLNSRVVIETKDSFGQNMAVNFQLLNTKNDTLINATTDSLGLYMFDLMPVANEKYQILAKNKVFLLPVAQTKGTTMSVDNLSNAEFIRVLIQSNQTSEDTLTLAFIKNGKLLYWKSFKNDKSKNLLIVPKKSLGGKINCYLLNNKGQELAERVIEIFANKDSLDIIAHDKKLVCEFPSYHFFYSDKFPYRLEKGLTINGTITQLNGKKPKKKVNLSMLISSLEEDTLQEKAKTFTMECSEKFIFQNLDFYSKKKITFIAPNHLISIDTVVEAPSIFAQKLPINWKLVQSDNKNNELENRKMKVLSKIMDEQAKIEKSIMLEEAVIKVKSIENYNQFGINPDLIMRSERISQMPNLTIVLNQIGSQYRRYNKVAIFLDALEIINPDELSGIPPQSIDKILVFTDVSATPLAGRNQAAYTIVILTKKGVDLQKSYQPNQNFIVNGYYQDD